MLMRNISILLVMTLMCIHHANAASCATATPPAQASAQGLTHLAMCDDWTDGTASIDTGDTRNPATCSGATNVPAGVCHWYVHRAWPQAACANCPTGAGPSNLLNLAATKTVDYSVSSGALLLQPLQVTTTGNNTSGANTITAIANTTNLQTNGSLVVAGTGIPAATWCTLSGTTCTMNHNSTAGSTGGTYVFGNVYNGWMLQACAATSGGSIGNPISGNAYIQVTATVPSPGANWSGTESEPEVWAWPIEFLTSSLSNPTSGSPVNFVEYDIFDYQNPTAPNTQMFTETVDGDGNLYFLDNPGPGATAQYGWGLSQNLGSGPPVQYGFLLMTPTSGAGGGANIGEFVFDDNGTVLTPQGTLQYGPSIVPTQQPGGYTPGGVNGTYVPAAADHFCLQLDAAPDFPQTIGGAGLIGVAVWTAPPAAPGPGGGRRMRVGADSRQRLAERLQ